MIDHFVSICKWCGRWLAILLLSLLITLPFIGLSIELTGVLVRNYFGIDDSSFERNWALGAAFFGYLMIAAAGSFIIIWPLALWGSRKLVNRLLRKTFEIVQNKTRSHGFAVPLANKFLSAPLIKGYLGTWTMVIFWMVYGYVGWPIEPDARVGSSKVYEVIGKPTFRDSSGAKGSSQYFAVNGMRLNSSFGLFGGRGGYGLFSGAVDPKKPVRATYFWRPTRLWYGDRMLHTLEQEGRQIVSPQQLHAERVQSYERGWKFYYELHVFVIAVTTILWFIERSMLKRNETIHGEK